MVVLDLIKIIPADTWVELMQFDNELEIFGGTADEILNFEKEYLSWEVVKLDSMRDKHSSAIALFIRDDEIVRITEDEFCSLYPDYYISVNGKYDNLPRKAFVLSSCRVDGEPTDMWVGVDNRTGDCWIEDFESLNEAIEWINE